MTALGILWFILIAVLICGYFVLDGFDLGAGVLYPFVARDDRDRSIIRRAIGPVWDGNEVWLLTAGGALFAAFAPAYAASFSGFYLAIMLVLFGLILRATALEFRGHDAAWAKLWDALFFIGSLVPTLLFGVAVGNIVQGVPLDANGDYTGTFFALLNPFALACGVLGLVHMLLQGSTWLALKAPAGEGLQERAGKLRRVFALAELAVFALVTLLFFLQVVPGSAAGITATTGSALCALAFVATTVAVLVNAGSAKVCDLGLHVLSSLGCAALVGIMATTLFPNLIPATDPAFSITIANAASSDTSLIAMTVIAAIGVPLVLVYHVVSYRIFSGRVKDSELGY